MFQSFENTRWHKTQKDPIDNGKHRSQLQMNKNLRMAVLDGIDSNNFVIDSNNTVERKLFNENDQLTKKNI